MSSTFPGPFHQPPQARCPPLTGRASNAQPPGAQAVAGASSSESGIEDQSSGGGSDAQEMDFKPGTSSHSRNTSKASTDSVPSPHLNIEPSIPVQFPPKPTRGAAWRGSYLARRSTAVGVSASIQDTKSQYTEAPAIAKVYSQNHSADFSPWRGTHLEDNIAEQTVKTGFQNKPLITNESNTARPSLWTQMKKNGPSTLSSIFVSLLEKRQANGKLSAPSTFKLPPRITMTLARKASFFKELGDASWPLRKLARSIPHGIGGKVLLDQFLEGFVPTPRAVWLIKCIGSHELRLLKRKSAPNTTAMSGEAKWIKDWTGQVEQFLKAVIPSVGEGDWKKRIDYALRLSAHLFSDRLLDEDHFLDWILLSLSTATLENLPVWLLLVRIYSKSIIRSRRRGKRLAEVLLNHLYQNDYSENDDDLLGPVLKLVQDTLCKLATSRPICLMLSENWTKYGPLLKSVSMKSSPPEIKQAIEGILFRNGRLLGTIDSIPPPNTIDQLISLLDTQSLRVTCNQLISKCLNITADLTVLLDVILRWATSIFRQGRYRIYIASRLLRNLYDRGFNINELVWSVVERHGNNPSIDESGLIQIVLELIRSRHFSTGRFLQHLIATGAIRSRASPACSPLLRLLRDLPNQDASEGISNLRLSLLESAGFENSAEAASFLQIQQSLSSSLSEVVNSSNTLSTDTFLSLKHLSLAQKSHLAFRIRRQMIDSSRLILARQDEENAAGVERNMENSFLLVRNVLEQIEDYPCLADIIGLLLDSRNQVLLTILSQTLHAGYNNFIGLGAMKGLFDKLCSAYEAVRVHALVKPLASAILDLCTVLDATKSLIGQLTQDLLRCDQLIAAMCSPASELNVDTPRPGVAESDVDIDRVLLNGTTMDQITFERVFKLITGKMEKAFQSNATASIPSGNWFRRLREFDSSNFDMLAHYWITSLLPSFGSEPYLYTYVLPVLIGTSCISHVEYLKIARGNQSSLQNEDHLKFQANLHLLEFLIPNQYQIAQINVQEMYQFKLAAQDFARTSPMVIIDLLEDVLAYSTISENSPVLERATTLLRSFNIVDLFKEYICTSKECVPRLRTLLAKSVNIPDSPCWIESLLDPFDRLDLRNLPRTEKITLIVDKTDHISLVTSSLALSAFEFPEFLQSSLPEDVIGSLMQSFLQLGNSSDLNDIHYQLLSDLSSSTKRKILETCETYVLDGFEPLNAAHGVLDIYINVIKHTMMAVDHEQDALISMRLVDRLKTASQHYYKAHQYDAADRLAERLTKDVQENIKTWIFGLLHLCIIHNLPRSCPPVQKPFAVDLLVVLCASISTKAFQDSPDILQYLVDITALCADTLSDEQRLAFIKVDFSRSSEPLLSYILGAPSTQGYDNWLGLVSSIQQTASTQAVTPVSSQSSQLPPAQGQTRPGGPQTPRPAANPPTPQSSSQAQQRPGAVARPSGGQQQPNKPMAPPIPFHLKPWEMLPDQGNVAAINDTAINLALFGARKV